MNTLHEVLTVLLGAESEAKRIVEDSKQNSAEALRLTQEKFAAERKNEIDAARSKANEITNAAFEAAKTEAAQIAAMGADERERIKKRFAENSDSVIASFVNETAEGFIAKKRG
ncbi:MAG: hypothetical protein Q4E17_02965 [Synergistes sp.]|nr:hypothetical protein [Synergistes sp.]